MPETIYLDTCALNRLNDTSTQPRIRDETEAVVRILELVAERKLRWVASTVLRYEVARNTDLVRRLDALEILSGATEIVDPSASTIALAQTFKARGCPLWMHCTSLSRGRPGPIGSSPPTTAF